MDFQISALDAEHFRHLSGMDTEALVKQGIVVATADSKPGYPCRVSLEDAEVGERMFLMNYEHQPAASPFRSSHAIYVRENASQARPAVNEVPQMLKSRLLSVRAFDAKGMMVAADLVAGEGLVQLLEPMLADTSIEIVHIHNARLGCYLAMAERC